jgi:5-methylcytosine-specific restriction endonuclease McrA
MAPDMVTSVKVPHQIWRAVFLRDRGTCRYCDEDLLASFSRYWSATVDHVFAVSVGGAHEAENLVLCCSSCNGMLSRAGHVQTVDERRAHVQRRRVAEKAGFESWRAELRPGQR